MSISTMAAPMVPIHITWDDPHKGRPKTFCGAKLRAGMIFTKYSYHLEGPRDPKGNLNAVRVRTGSNTTSTRFVMRSRYDETICLRCLESEDYNLALLAVLP